MEIFALLGVIGLISFIFGLLTEDTGYFIGRCVKALTRLMLKLVINTTTALYVFLFNQEKKTSKSSQSNTSENETIYASYAGKSGRELAVYEQSHSHRAPGLVYDEQRKMFVKTAAISKK